MELTILTETGMCVLQAQPGQSLLQALQGHAGISAPCGGMGTCGKCKVRLLDENGETEVRACATPVAPGMKVKIPDGAGVAVLLSSADERQAQADGKLSGYGIACDLGTTTIACRLLDLTDGRQLAAMGEANGQCAYGADVITRIQASMNGKLPALTGVIRSQLGRMLRTLCEAADIRPESLQLMTVAGNPTMCHILTGLCPDSLGAAPYSPLSLFGDYRPAEALQLPFAGEVYVLPAVSGYVGGDITADLIAQELDRRKRPALLIDIGTNGEMAIGCVEQLLCCSTAAGPVFEGAHIRCGMTASPGAISAVHWDGTGPVCTVNGGGSAKGLCGSGLIDAVAMLLRLGIVDETGYMLDVEEDEEEIPDAFAPYLLRIEDTPAFRLADAVYITQADIRKFQLGKAAIAAGAAILRERYEMRFGQQPEELILAGGFGSYINPDSAAVTGLIPRDLLAVTRSVGNAAVRGAELALLSEKNRSRLHMLQQSMEYLELSGMRDFQKHYIEAMLFPDVEEA